MDLTKRVKTRVQASRHQHQHIDLNVTHGSHGHDKQGHHHHEAIYESCTIIYDIPRQSHNMPPTMESDPNAFSSTAEIETKKEMKQGAPSKSTPQQCHQLEDRYEMWGWIYSPAMPPFTHRATPPSWGSLFGFAHHDATNNPIHFDFLFQRPRMMTVQRVPARIRCRQRSPISTLDRTRYPPRPPLPTGKKLEVRQTKKKLKNSIIKNYHRLFVSARKACLDSD